MEGWKVGSGLCLERDGAFGAFVHRQRKHVRARVMSHHVKIVPRLGQCVQVDAGGVTRPVSCCSGPASTSPKGPTIMLLP